MDWTALLNTAGKAAGDDLDALKAGLPIAYVLERAGRAIVDYDGTSAHTYCPFHSDSDPSFDVFGENLERWGCFPCGINGDVLDLIGRLFKITEFKTVLEAARQLTDEMKAAGWTGPTTGVKREFDWEAARALVAEATASEDQAEPVVQAFLDAKVSKGSAALGEFTADWLVKEFRVGSRGVEVIIPYFDREGATVSYKHRTAETKALSPSGSGQFDNVLYGEWKDDGERPVVLCEGESDVWAAHAAVGAQFTVLGLPVGAGAHPKQASRLNGRKVVVAFDGDEAGRAAAVKWYAALKNEGCDVWLAPVPDDCDLSSLNLAGIRDVLKRSRAVPSVPKGLLITEAGYARPGKEENTPLSNWTFSPSRELLGDGGSAYEGILLPGGEEAVLSSFDMMTKNRIVGWSTKHGGSWYGSDRDAQLLLGVLQAQGPFLAPGRMSTTAGLHEGHFIWPGGRIGAEHWVYVPPATDIHLADRMKLDGNHPWDPSQVSILRDLHSHRVTDPILAWLALAPLRSMLREFPILAITGSSGSGKTTLTETLVRHFTGSLITNNLTATTRHSVFSFIGSTNAFPVWFDEYRPGARKDAMETLNQLLRDAYTGQSSSKGGMGESWAEVTSVQTSAPIIVSGEDAFHETSHTERMVLVNLPVEGRNPGALDRIKGWQDHSFAYAYLTWLHIGLQEGYLPVIRNFDAGPEDLPGRQRINLGALYLGWALLSQFVFQFGGIELGEPDFSLIIEEGREAAQHNPIKDCILWMLDEDEAEDAVLLDHEGMVHVRAENFVARAEKFGFTLPGGPKAIASYLRTNYGAEPSEYTIYGRTRKALAFPHSVLSESGGD